MTPTDIKHPFCSPSIDPDPKAETEDRSPGTPPKRRHEEARPPRGLSLLLGMQGVINRLLTIRIDSEPTAHTRHRRVINIMVEEEALRLSLEQVMHNMYVLCMTCFA